MVTTYPQALKRHLEQEYTPGRQQRWQIPQDTREHRIRTMGLYDRLDEVVDPGDTVVEIGCSSGVTTNELDDHYPAADVIGVDILDGFSSPGEYVQAGAAALPFADDAVDVVLAPNSLGRVVHKGLIDEMQGADATAQYVDTVLAELGRTAADDGTFLMADGEEGSAYLLAENDDDGWELDELCSYEGAFRSRLAPYIYRDWLDSPELAADEYDERTMTPDDHPTRTDLR